MTFKRILLVSLVFFLIASVVAVRLYPRLPAEVPTRRGYHCDVDGTTTSRFWATAMPALLILGWAVLTCMLPVISPRRFEIKSFAQVYVIVMPAMQALMLVTCVAMLLFAVGYAVAMPKVAVFGTAALLLILGSDMGKFCENFFIGIRTPWMLASAVVWERTHRLGGWLLRLAGLLLIVVTLADAPPWLAIALVLAAAFISALYSLVIYKRLSADE